MLYMRYGFVLSALLAVASPSFARENVLTQVIGSAMSMPEAQPRLRTTPNFYLGMQTTAQVTRNYGTFVVNHKTNGFAKAEGTACDRAFLPVPISMRKRALVVGANAVINIVGYYDKQEVSGETDFQCHKGFPMADVAPRGDVVRLADR
jgi:hypothetical protein